MKRNIVYTTIATALITAAFSGCSMTAEVAPTPVPVEKPAAVQTVLGDYALLEGHTLYQGKDNAY